MSIESLCDAYTRTNISQECFELQAFQNRVGTLKTVIDFSELDVHLVEECKDTPQRNFIKQCVENAREL